MVQERPRPPQSYWQSHCASGKALTPGSPVVSVHARPGLPVRGGERAHLLAWGRLCVRGAPSSPSLHPFPVRGPGLSCAAPEGCVQTTALHGWGCGHAGGLGTGIPAVAGPASPLRQTSLPPCLRVVFLLSFPSWVSFLEYAYQTPEELTVS